MEQSSQASGHKISHGRFALSEDFLEKYQSLDARFIKNRPATFFFEMDSDAMAPLISQGDLLLVDRSLEPFPGDIMIVAWEGSFHCKKWIKKSGRNYLVSLQTSHQYLPFTEAISCWGVVRTIIRELL